MTILDSFYILFGTKNASQTRAEIASIDKQLDDMDKKSKKRGDVEDKRYQELKKQRKELLESLLQQQRALDSLGNSFDNFAKNAIGAGLGYLSFGALKIGILDAQKFNRELAIQARISGQNVTELKAYGAAFEQTGGNAEGFLSLIRNWTSIAAQANRPLKNVGDLIGYIRGQLKGPDGKPLPLQTQQFILQQRYGLPTEALPFFEQTDAQFDALIKKNKELAAVTEQDTHIADDFGQAWSNAIQEMDKRFTHLGSVVLPYVTRALKGLVDNAEHGKSTTDLLLDSEATSIKQILRFFGIKGKSPAGERSPLYPSPLFPSEDKTSQKPEEKSSKQQIIDFWRANGYDAGAVAAWTAQAQAESTFGKNLVNGSHVGLYQWSPERRRKILAGTDIDVATAPLHDQLKAALWEAQTNYGLTPTALNGRGPATASNILTSQYEIPYTNPIQLAAESSRRAQIAQSYRLPSFDSGSTDNRTVNVKIDDIHVNTQATSPSDIANGIGSALQNEFRNAVWNVNDGIGS